MVHWLPIQFEKPFWKISVAGVPTALFQKGSVGPFLCALQGFTWNLEETTLVCASVKQHPSSRHNALIHRPQRDSGDAINFPQTRVMLSGEPKPP